jgi:hypothetical protein
MYVCIYICICIYNVYVYHFTAVTGDIIRNVGDGEFSRAEVAYSLLIGTGLPGEPRQVYI